METGGDQWLPKLVQFLSLPMLIWNLAKALRGADAIHVRCPGNLGLLGVVLGPLFSNYLVAKYAGQWNGYQGEPISVWLQRRLLRSFWWRRGVVTVYGEWPNQPGQIVPFFTSMMTSDQVRRSVEVARGKRLGTPIEILYIGRLSGLKGVDVLLRAARLISNQGVAFRLSVIGDGPEADQLKKLAAELNLGESAVFTGALPYNEVMTWYQKGHILVLPSRHSEGWPKVLTEAMCHGLVCISTDHGLIPWLLRDRGHVVPVDNVYALAACLMNVASDRDEYLRTSHAAASWAQKYSLEGLRDALGILLSRKWRMVVPISSQAQN
jgi:glycosyltransferase involved in cell wall biosynthesis